MRAPLGLVALQIRFWVAAGCKEPVPRQVTRMSLSWADRCPNLGLVSGILVTAPLSLCQGRMDM